MGERARATTGRIAFAAILSGAVLLGAPAVASGSEAKAVHHHPQIHVGGFPTGISLDPSTDTIYVGNGTDDDLSLITGANCNSSVTSGCGQHIVAVTAGTDPIGSVVDPTTDTVYAVNDSSDSVAVINGRTCNARNTSGCRHKPALIKVGSGPEFAAVDPNTHTLYVANLDGDTVSVVNLRACDGTVSSGCGRAVVGLVHSGPDPFAVAVDTASDTIYVTNDGTNTVTVIDGRTCNSLTVSGCGSSRREFVGLGPGGIAIDQATNTVYVADETSDDVSMFNGSTCDAANVSKCGQHAYRLVAGDGDRGVAVDDSTDSVYVTNTDNNTVLVFSGHACNGSVHTGCNHHGIAHVGASPRRVVVDPSTDTIYVTNADGNTVSMIDGRTCNGNTTGGC